MHSCWQCHELCYCHGDIDDIDYGEPGWCACECHDADDDINAESEFYDQPDDWTGDADA